MRASRRLRVIATERDIADSRATVVLGVDLGTSALKVVALSDEGAVLARAAREYPTHRPRARAAEQIPGDWCGACDGALERTRRRSPASWAGLGLSAMLPTLVELDDDGQPLGPAITWEDARAEPEAEAFSTRSEPGLYGLTGQRLDGRYLLPMHARLRR